MRRLLANKKAQFLFNGGFGLVLLGVSLVSARHFMHQGWPFHHADPILVGGASVLYLIAYAFKAWGWQRLFHEEERPGAGAMRPEVDPQRRSTVARAAGSVSRR